MGNLIRIAFRNLNRQKKRSFLLGGAIAFGIMIVTIINGFAGAFQQNVAGNMAQLFAGHVYVEASEKSESGKRIDIIRDDAPIMAALTDAGIDTSYIARRSAATVTLIFEGKKTDQQVMGADLADELFLRERLVLKKGTWENLDDPRALILSEDVAAKLKVEVGDKVLVQLKTYTGQNNVGEFILAGISQDMGLFSAMVAYTHRAYLNELLAMEPSDYQIFGILLDDLSQAEAVSAKLLEALKNHAPSFELSAEDLAAISASGLRDSRYSRLLKQAKDQTWEGSKYRVFTINDMISQIEELVRTLNLVSTIILLVLFLIIMVGIANTFRMIMYERIKEIGTMRAVGMQRGSVRNLFLTEAGLLGSGGAIVGWLAAGVVMLILSIHDYGTGTFFSLLLKNGHLSFAIQPAQALANYLLVLFLTLLAALMPARKASKLPPAVALRTAK